MILIHDKELRGRTRTGWLDSHHSFSFGSFQDPKRMGFGNLRVINEDRIIPGSGFAAHRHESMDILTYVIAGRLRHEDDQGHVAEIGEGEVQLMSAGAGIEHGEWNASDTEPAYFLQIWLIPDDLGGPPTYQQTRLPRTGDVLLAAEVGRGALLDLRSKSELRVLRAAEGQASTFDAAPDRRLFIQLVDGLAHADGERVSAGDGLQLSTGEALTLNWQSEGEALLFSMPARAES